MLIIYIMAVKPGRVCVYCVSGMSQASSVQSNAAAAVTEAIDDCGLRFLLASRHHVYLLNTLPLRQRAQLQQLGLSPAYYVWAFHSESQVLTFHQLSDWLSCGFTSHTTQNRSFRRRFSKFGMEKMNLAQQKHAFSNQKKSTVIQNKQKSRLLQLAAWKPSGSSLKGKDK